MDPVQCVMLSLAVLCSVLLVLRVSKNLGTSVITLIFNIAFLGISPWKIIPYTDGCTIAMPVMILFLYSMVRGQAKAVELCSLVPAYVSRDA